MYAGIARKIATFPEFHAVLACSKGRFASFGLLIPVCTPRPVIPRSLGAGRLDSHPERRDCLGGLAASYDKLRRFDLADQAYAQAIRLGGETVQVLNDQGHSYMLRGNLSAARRKFEKAFSLEPGNPVIANNLELLNGSQRFIERPPNNQP